MIINNIKIYSTEHLLPFIRQKTCLKQNFNAIMLPKMRYSVDGQT